MMEKDTMTKPKEEEPTGLALLRKPFPPHQISKLPKATKAQTDAVRADFKSGIRCKVCGQWHHKDVVHLDYVGHAALTDRLLDCDPMWNWEPVATLPNGTPEFDKFGGMWIRLTVCGVTRLGYGHPDGKSGGDAVKEVIGDAMRNAAMRFGAALDLWHKGELHVDDAVEEPAPRHQSRQPEPQRTGPDPVMIACDSLANADTLDQLAAIWRDLPPGMKAHHLVVAAKDGRKAALQPPIVDDEIPY
jgi:hypothetical protein